MKGALSISALVAVLVMLMMSGCGDDECVCPEVPGQADYFPMSVGNWWAFASDTTFFLGDRTWRIGTLRVVRKE